MLTNVRKIRTGVYQRTGFVFVTTCWLSRVYFPKTEASEIKVISVLLDLKHNEFTMRATNRNGCNKNVLVFCLSFTGLFLIVCWCLAKVFCAEFEPNINSLPSPTCTPPFFLTVKPWRKSRRAYIYTFIWIPKGPKSFVCRLVPCCYSGVLGVRGVWRITQTTERSWEENCNWASTGLHKC